MASAKVGHDERCALCAGTPAELCAAGEHALCAECRARPLWGGACPGCAATRTREMREALLCSVCLELPEGRVSQCFNGHLLCESCARALRPARAHQPSSRCPVCRERLPSGRGIRALSAEKHVRVLLSVRCPRCREPTTAPALRDGTHACPRVRERLLSCTYEDRVETFAGVQHEERRVAVRRLASGGTGALRRKEFANRIEEFAGPPGEEWRRAEVRGEAGDGRAWTDEGGARREAGQKVTFFAPDGSCEVVETRGRVERFWPGGRLASSTCREGDRGEERAGETRRFSRGGELLARAFAPPHRLQGQTWFFTDGRHTHTRRVTLDGEEEAHFDVHGRLVRKLFVRDAVRQGQVAHYFPAASGREGLARVMSFTAGHARSGQLVFYWPEGDHMTSWRPRRGSTPADFARFCAAHPLGARRDCALCGARKCPCRAGLFCLPCLEGARRILVSGCRTASCPAADVAPGQVVRVEAAADRALVGCLGLVEGGPGELSVHLCFDTKCVLDDDVVLLSDACLCHDRRLASLTVAALPPLAA